MAVTISGDGSVTGINIEATDIADGTITAAKLSNDIEFGVTTIGNDDTATYSDGEYFLSSTNKVYRLLNDGTSSAWYSLADGTKQSNNEVSVETTFSAGQYHSAYVNSDGELYVAGYNTAGALGLGDLTDRTSWTKVNIDNVVKVFCTSFATFVIKGDGTVWGTGANANGQLGLGDTTNRTSFTELNITDVSKISGGNHTMILKTDGSLWTCGQGGNYALGNGTSTDTSSFAQIVSSGVVDIYGSGSASYYINSSGAVYSCGYNGYGQLGNGTTTDRTTFGATTITSGASKFASGWNYNLAGVIKSDGSLWSCGRNNFYTLNTGNTTDQSSFIQVYSSGVADATIGSYSISVLKTDGSVYSIGYNYYGQIGNGSTNTSSPYAVSSFYQNFSSGSNVVNIFRGGDHFFIIEDDNTISSVGFNDFGQLALGDTTDRTSFVDTGITDAITEDQAASNKTVAELA